MRPLTSHDFDDFVHDGFHCLDFQNASLVQNDAAVGGKEFVRANVAGLAQAAADKVFRVQRNRVPIPHGLAGDLAQDQITACQNSDDNCRTTFGLAQIRTREWDNDDIAFYILQMLPCRVLFRQHPFLSERRLTHQIPRDILRRQRLSLPNNRHEVFRQRQTFLCGFLSDLRLNVRR